MPTLVAPQDRPAGLPGLLFKGSLWRPDYRGSVRISDLHALSQAAVASRVDVVLTSLSFDTANGKAHHMAPGIYDIRTHGLARHELIILKNSLEAVDFWVLPHLDGVANDHFHLERFARKRHMEIP